MSSKTNAYALAVTGSEGFPQRLEQVVGRRSLKEFGLHCGLSEGVLRKYLKGESLPTIDRLEAIARTGEVDPGWLISGNQVADTPTRYNVAVKLDADLLGEILQAVDDGLTQINISLNNRKKSTMIALLYDYYAGKGEPVSMGNVIRFIDIAK